MLVRVWEWRPAPNLEHALHAKEGVKSSALKGFFK
jgi:hypothetical protein